MAIELTVTHQGGHRLREHLRRAKRAAGVKRIIVGFGDERYPDGTKVSDVAKWNAFGTPFAKNPIPPRPFWQQAMKASQEEVKARLKGVGYKRQRPGIDRTAARDVAMIIRRNIRKRIRDLRSPPNAPSTIRKKGFDNPLIWTKRMHDAVQFRIE